MRTTIITLRFRELAAAMAAVATFSALALASATPASAAEPTVTAPEVVYPSTNTPMNFDATIDPVSGDARAVSVNSLAEGPDGCRDATYSVAGCPTVRLALSTAAAGLLRIPGNQVVQDGNGATHVIAASGAIVAQSTDTTGGDSQRFSLAGTQAQLNDTLSALAFVPATDYRENQTGDASLPQLEVLAASADEAAGSSRRVVYLKVEGANEAPTLVAPPESLAATTGQSAEYDSVVGVSDPDTVDDDQMLLVAWLPQDQCGTFSFASDSSFTSVGGTDASVHAVLEDSSGLDYRDDQAAAVESSLPPVALNLDLSGQAAPGQPTTVFAGVGGLDDVDYALGHLRFDAPETAASCELTYAVSDLGHTGTPTSYVGSPVGGQGQPQPGYEVPDAKGATAAITFDVREPVDNHPQVSVEQSASATDPTGTDATFTVTFSQEVDAFAANDVDTSASTAPGARCAPDEDTPGLVYTLHCSAQQDGTIQAAVDAGTVYAPGHAGEAAYGNAASTSTDNSITWDAGPTVTIDQASAQADPTRVSPIVFAVRFGEPVTGFDSSDVDLSASTTGPLQASVSGSGAAYTVSVTGMSNDGAVRASIAAGAATDAASNSSQPSTSTDATVTWQQPPSVTINQAAGQTDPSGLTSIRFAVVFSEPVTGFTNSDVSVSGTAGATSAVVSGSGATYSVDVSGMRRTGFVTAAVAAGVAVDASSNPNFASTSTDNTVRFLRPTGDVTKPGVTIDQQGDQPDPTTNTAIRFAVVFSEPVGGFTDSDVSISGTTGAKGVTVTGSGANYTVTVTGMLRGGTLSVSIAANKAADASLNGNTASTSTDNAVTYVLWDYFQRSDRYLAGDRSPGGYFYHSSGRVKAVIRDGRYVREDPTKVGALGHSILMQTLGHAPTIVTSKYVFTPGDTVGDAAITATCTTGLGTSSVQFVVGPTTWRIVDVRTISVDGKPTVVYHVLSSGYNSSPLATDGSTQYSTTMQYNAATSSVTVTWGTGQTRTFTDTDPLYGISANWGKSVVAQIRHLKSTDGDIQFTGFGSD